METIIKQAEESKRTAQVQFLQITQPYEINMALLFLYLVKNDFRMLLYYSVHWTSHFLKGIRNTRPCITGRPVLGTELGILVDDWKSIESIGKWFFKNLHDLYIVGQCEKVIVRLRAAVPGREPYADGPAGPGEAAGYPRGREGPAQVRRHPRQGQILLRPVAKADAGHSRPDDVQLPLPPPAPAQSLLQHGRPTFAALWLPWPFQGGLWSAV